MNRDQCNLFINNISDRTDEDRLISFFSQFGKIESFTFFRKNSYRRKPAAIITYHSSVNINSIIQRNQRISFDRNTLFLRRTLPIMRPAFERFMSSNELLVSLNDVSHDEQFNEINLRKYFSQYGSIVSCRLVMPCTTYVIDFVEANSVDWAILDEPHFYEEKELILRKYVAPNRIELFRTSTLLFEQGERKTQWVLIEKLRRLEHIAEALRFGQTVQLRLIKMSYEEKKMRMMHERIDRLRKQCVQTREKVEAMKLLIEQNELYRKEIRHLYENKIQNERNRTEELKEAIDLLA